MVSRFNKLIIIARVFFFNFDLSTRTEFFRPAPRDHAIIYCFYKFSESSKRRYTTRIILLIIYQQCTMKDITKFIHTPSKSYLYMYVFANICFYIDTFII